MSNKITLTASFPLVIDRDKLKEFCPWDITEKEIASAILKMIPTPVGNPDERNAVPVCGRCGGLMDLMQGELNYCPNCGARIYWGE